MSLLCAECRRPVDDVALQCAEGHRYESRDGVLRLFSREFEHDFLAFSEAVQDFRQRLGKPILDESAYDGLPHNEALAGNAEWQRRVWDLDTVRRLLAPRPATTVLDVGSYNGWLARHLQDDGHDVTAVDFFADEHDGLGARRFYRDAKWTAIQLDLRDLSLLGTTYDVVILNRCTQFFPDPVAWTRHARERVSPGGILIATGLDLFANPEPKESTFQQLDRDFRNRYGMGFFLHPTRGVLDAQHLRAFQDDGWKIRWVRQLFARNLVSTVARSRPRFLFGVWTSDSDLRGANAGEMP